MTMHVQAAIVQSNLIPQNRYENRMHVGSPRNGCKRPACPWWGGLDPPSVDGGPRHVGDGGGRVCWRLWREILRGGESERLRDVRPPSDREASLRVGHPRRGAASEVLEHTPTVQSDVVSHRPGSCTIRLPAVRHFYSPGTTSSYARSPGGAASFRSRCCRSSTVRPSCNAVRRSIGCVRR